MVRGPTAQLAALCSLVSFAYISQSLDRHSLTGRPRLSSVLLLLFSGGFCFLASFFSKWLPGAQGRFDREKRGGTYFALPGGTKSTSTPMPPRPRRWSLPMLVFCVVTRLEVFHHVNYQQECSAHGVESFLCMLLWAYETLSDSRKLALAVPDDADDPWRSVFTDISEWLSGPRQAMIMSGVAVLVLNIGTFLAVSQVMKSTYICFAAIDNSAWIITLQVIGLFLDALIIILFWRILAWSRNTKSKLRALGSTLVISSISIALVWLGHRVYRGSRALEVGFGSLYGFDLVVDSTAFAALAISGAFWICDSAIAVPSTVLTITFGVWTTLSNVRYLGTWEQLSRAQLLLPPLLILYGFAWFSYTSDIRFLVFFKRIHVVVLLTIFLIATSTYSMTQHVPTFPRHPLSDLIIKGNIEENHWLRQVKTSHDLPVAAQVYLDRHEGRRPPPFFHEWYKLAKDTVVVDEFRQIDQDLAPFRKVPPKYLRQRVNIISGFPGIATITIKSTGDVSHSDTGDEKQNLELDKLVEIISRFAAFLPNMVLPMNLSPAPRVLPSWNEAQSSARVDLSTIVDLLQFDEKGDAAEGGGGQQISTLASARDLQNMHLAACPPTSKSRTSPHWRISDFCFSCARRHSKGPIMTRWDKSLEICHQPDVHHLHSFFMTDPTFKPFSQLLPLFSPSKMDGFSDIIFPLPSTIAAGSDTEKPISDRKNELYWRGSFGDHALSPQALRGGQKFRLMHLKTQPGSREEVTMILPLHKSKDGPDTQKGKNEKDKYAYERIKVAEANKGTSLTLQLQLEESCIDPNCGIATQYFPLTNLSGLTDPYEHRYILLTDEDDGPPVGVVGALRSKSTPFISTTFRTWYTERLLPWLHFVPIDIRFQALHTTIAYFTGTEGEAILNGQYTKMEDQLNEAQWIASQGQKWADKAVGQKDLEVYMFRLLLEWGRLIDDERDKIGFWQDSTGELQSSGWTPVQEGGRTS